MPARRAVRRGGPDLFSVNCSCGSRQQFLPVQLVVGVRGVRGEPAGQQAADIAAIRTAADPPKTALSAATRSNLIWAAAQFQQRPAHPHLLFLPVIATINVINVALGFGLTTVITALMLLATLYLCLWDYDRFRSLFTTRPFDAHNDVQTLELDRWETAGFTVFAIASLAFFGWTRGFVPDQAAFLAIRAGLTAGVFTLLRFCLIVWRRRRESA